MKQTQEKVKVAIFCYECGHKMDDVGRLCPRCGDTPSLDERLVLMKRQRVRQEEADARDEN